MRHHRCARLVIVALLLAVVALASAGRTSHTRVFAAQPAAGAQDEFVPVKDLPVQEQLPAAPMVIGAYAFVWLMLVGFVWSLWRRLGAVERDLDQVTRRVEDVRRS